MCLILAVFFQFHPLYFEMKQKRPEVFSSNGVSNRFAINCTQTTIVKCKFESTVLLTLIFYIISFTYKKQEMSSTNSGALNFCYNSLLFPSVCFVCQVQLECVTQWGEQLLLYSCYFCKIRPFMLFWLPLYSFFANT